MNDTSLPEAAYQALQADPLLQADVARWWSWRNKTEISPNEAFTSLYFGFAEFRSIVRYRFLQAGVSFAIMPKLRLTTDLYLRTDDIGGGLRVQHGHSTWVLAQRIGRDFHVNQNVTIGIHNGKKPVIGDRVKVHAGAVVVGGITIGDDVTIAPNAFVNFDVPSGKTVFPARAVIV